MGMRVAAQRSNVSLATVRTHFRSSDRLVHRAAIDCTEEHVFIPRLRSLLKSDGGDLFEDSMKLDSAQHWTWDLLKRFEKLRGYSLRERLPVVFIGRIYRQYTGVTSDDTPDFEFTDGSGTRVREDYFRPLLLGRRPTPPLPSDQTAFELGGG